MTREHCPCGAFLDEPHSVTPECQLFTVEPSGDPRMQPIVTLDLTAIQRRILAQNHRPHAPNCGCYYCD